MFKTMEVSFTTCSMFKTVHPDYKVLILESSGLTGVPLWIRKMFFSKLWQTWITGLADTRLD